MIIPSGDHSSAKPDGSFSKPCLVHHIRSHAVQKIQEKKKNNKKANTHNIKMSQKKIFLPLLSMAPNTQAGGGKLPCWHQQELGAPPRHSPSKIEIKG